MALGDQVIPSDTGNQLVNLVGVILSIIGVVVLLLLVAILFTRRPPRR